MKRSKRAEIKKLVRRVAELRSKVPAGGMSLAAFEALMLGGVSPSEVSTVVRTLHNRRAIFVRRNRGEIRIFAERPAKITGVFEGSAAVDTLLSSASPHMWHMACALAAREAAKGSGDLVAMNAARDALDVSAARVIGLARKHVERGVPLAAIRESIWATFAGGSVSFLAIFEPALARDAAGALSPSPVSKRRIENGLCPTEKVAALVEKAGFDGIHKTGLYQGMRPKLDADRLAAILDKLVAEDRVKARQVRVRGSRFATRFFKVELAQAA